MAAENSEKNDLLQKIEYYQNLIKSYKESNSTECNDETTIYNSERQKCKSIDDSVNHDLKVSEMSSKDKKINAVSSSNTKEDTKNPLKIDNKGQGLTKKIEEEREYSAQRNMIFSHLNKDSVSEKKRKYQSMSSSSDYQCEKKNVLPLSTVKATEKIPVKLGDVKTSTKANTRTMQDIHKSLNNISSIHSKLKKVTAESKSTSSVQKMNEKCIEIDQGSTIGSDPKLKKEVTSLKVDTNKTKNAEIAKLQEKLDSMKYLCKNNQEYIDKIVKGAKNKADLSKPKSPPFKSKNTSVLGKKSKFKLINKNLNPWIDKRQSESAQSSFRKINQYKLVKKKVNTQSTKTWTPIKWKMFVQKQNFSTMSSPASRRQSLGLHQSPMSNSYVKSRALVRNSLYKIGKYSLRKVEGNTQYKYQLSWKKFKTGHQYHTSLAFRKRHHLKGNDARSPLMRLKSNYKLQYISMRKFYDKTRTGTSHTGFVKIRNDLYHKKGHKIVKIGSASTSGRNKTLRKVLHTTPLKFQSEKNAKQLAARVVLNKSIIHHHRSKNPHRSDHRTKSSKRSKQDANDCIYYKRFGKCNRGNSCSFIHDKNKVAVCTRYIRGTCQVDNCPFSHNLSKEKMPVCRFFLKGLCFKENCPYLHVNVGQNADLCEDFINGYCAEGDQCKKKHMLYCPEFSSSGKCRKGIQCRLRHSLKKESEKPSPPKEVLKRKVLLSNSSQSDSDDATLPFKQRKLPAYIALSSSPSPQSKKFKSSRDKQEKEKTPEIKIRPNLSLPDEIDINKC